MDRCHRCFGIADHEDLGERCFCRRDPLTGEVMETVGEIRRVAGTCVDATGREVALNAKGTWVYA